MRKIALITLLLGMGLLGVMSCGEDPVKPAGDQDPPDVSGIVATPADGASDVPYPVPLSWPGAVDDWTGIAEYRVLLDENPSPATAIYSSSKTSRVVSGLSPLTTYYWQVVVVDVAGNETTAGPWSFTTGSFLFDVVQIPPASTSLPVTYNMGGSGGGDTPHDVTLTGRMLMAETEVTEEAWDAVMGDGTSTSQLPQANVTWDAAVTFCNALSDINGLTRAYTINGPDGDVERVEGANGWRLPTEAEWEYACRAGTDTPFNTGACLDADTDANYYGDHPYTGCTAGQHLDQAVAVKSYPANCWGLYDMHGNLREWCYDRWWTDYGSFSGPDPVYDGLPGAYRVVRGGDWSISAEVCRSASRYQNFPDFSSDFGGFRPVISLD